MTNIFLVLLALFHCHPGHSAGISYPYHRHPLSFVKHRT